MLQIIGNATHIRISCNWSLKSLHQYVKRCSNHCKLLIKTIATTSTYTFNEIANKIHATLQQEVKEVEITTCHNNQSGELLMYRSRVSPILRAQRWCHGGLGSRPRCRQLQRVENNEVDTSSTQGWSSLDHKRQHHGKWLCFCVDLRVGSLPMVGSFATTSMMGVLRWCDLKWWQGWMISIDNCMGAAPDPWSSQGDGAHNPCPTCHGNLVATRLNHAHPDALQICPAYLPTSMCRIDSLCVCIYIQMLFIT
jgi:hypothetical protein